MTKHVLWSCLIGPLCPFCIWMPTFFSKLVNFPAIIFPNRFYNPLFSPIPSGNIKTCFFNHLIVFQTSQEPFPCFLCFSDSYFPKHSPRYSFLCSTKCYQWFVLCFYLLNTSFLIFLFALFSIIFHCPMVYPYHVLICWHHLTISLYFQVTLPSFFGTRFKTFH